MASSDPTTIPKVVLLTQSLRPKTVLDVGPGNGKYGLLFREYLDMNYGRELKDSWKVVIDCVEVEYKYITPVHHFAYTNVFIIDWMDFEPKVKYDFIFMGDVLEHFTDWQEALSKARINSVITMVVSPNWPGSTAQGAIYGHEHEDHKVALTPQMVGGRCIFANSKIFMCVFDNLNTGIFDGKDFLL